jgi:hypothetical protein
MPAQDEDRRLGVLLAQPGTPDAPTPAAPESHTLRPDAAPPARKCPGGRGAGHRCSISESVEERADGE